MRPERLAEMEEAVALTRHHLNPIVVEMSLALGETVTALTRANDLLQRAKNNIGHHYVFACPHCLPESDELKADIDAYLASEAPQ